MSFLAKNPSCRKSSFPAASKKNLRWNHPNFVFFSLVWGLPNVDEFDLQAPCVFLFQFHQDGSHEFAGNTLSRPEVCETGNGRDRNRRIGPEGGDSTPNAPEKSDDCDESNES
jgi:hypothetical protein